MEYRLICEKDIEPDFLKDNFPGKIPLVNLG